MRYPLGTLFDQLEGEDIWGQEDRSKENKSF